MLESEEVKILHVCAGWQPWNGAANIARMIMDEQRREGREVSSATWAKVRELRTADEVWIHCGWLPCLWWAALWGRNVRWMPEACYDPVRLRYHGWKKWLVGPIERWCLRRCAKIVATCEAEAEWIRAYEPRVKSIEVTDIKRFFKLKPASSPITNLPANSSAIASAKADPPSLHLLYLGRRHPLKGLSYLETALATYYNKWSSAPSSLAPTTACADNPSSNPSRKAATYYNKCPIEFRVVSDAFGDELERVWDWCDVLVLPTLSENFGLVVAEALERGKRVITTDGAPAWNHEIHETHEKGVWSGYGGRLIYLKGYRDGTDEERVELLKKAIERICK